MADWESPPKNKCGRRGLKMEGLRGEKDLPNGGLFGNSRAGGSMLGIRGLGIYEWQEGCWGQQTKARTPKKVPPWSARM